jgi:hypothetical protein
MRRPLPNSAQEPTVARFAHFRRLSAPNRWPDEERQ